jgi:sugar lactone lactonase YvrE
MTVDDEGMLWVALGRAGAIHRYRADGTLDGAIEVLATNPTSPAAWSRFRTSGTASSP